MAVQFLFLIVGNSSFLAEILNIMESDWFNNPFNCLRAMEVKENERSLLEVDPPFMVSSGEK